MFDYTTLKNSYIATVQIGLELGFSDPKQGNDLLHDFCEKLVENSNYSEFEKQNMKRDLDLVNNALSQEIELRLCSSQQ